MKVVRKLEISEQLPIKTAQYGVFCKIARLPTGFPNNSISFFCLSLFVLLQGAACAGGYVLTGNVVDASFSREGAAPAYQKNVRYQASSWGLYNWFPERKRKPDASEEIVVYGKARRITQAYEAAGFLLGIPTNSFVPTYEWNGEVTILKENSVVAIPVKAVFANNKETAHFYRVVCGDAVVTVQDVIATYTLIENAPYRFAVFSLPENDYTVYITTWKELRPIGKQGNIPAASSPRNSLTDLVTLKRQVFQILDSDGNLAAEYSDSRTTLYDNAPKNDIDALFGCVGMLHLIVNIANNSAGI
jgi:hypothetical protein